MARARCYHLFSTAIGECGIAWNADGLTRVWLPATNGPLERTVRACEADARAALPAGEIARATEAIARLLGGEHVALDSVPLDAAGLDAFDAGVYAIARTIRPGEVCTYGDVAARLGTAGAARAVGRSLGRNPWPIVVPCHRVVAAGRALGGFSAPGGAATKSRLLAIERARRADGPDLFDTPSVSDTPGIAVTPSAKEAR